MYAAPLDLLGAALGAQLDRVRAVTARWRRAGLAATRRIGPGPGWVWLTRPGMRATGLTYPVRPPGLAHTRAVLAVRVALQASDVFETGQAWWRSERHIRSRSGRPGTVHVTDAEVWWRPVPGSPYTDECWAIEAELTPRARSGPRRS
jgi:hypothetical protein